MGVQLRNSDKEEDKTRGSHGLIPFPHSCGGVDRTNKSSVKQKYAAWSEGRKT